MQSDLHPKDQLLDFAYDELTDPARSELESHLRGCPECARELEGIRGVRRAASQLPTEAPPEDGLASLLAYAEKATQRPAEAPKRRAWWGWLSAGVSVVAVTFVVLLVFSDAIRSRLGSSADALSGRSAVAMRTPASSRRIEARSLSSFGPEASAPAEMEAPPPPAAAPARRALKAAPKPQAEAMGRSARAALSDAFRSNDVVRSQRPFGGVSDGRVSRFHAKQTRVAHRRPARPAKVAEALAVPAAPPPVAASAGGFGARVAQAPGARMTGGPVADERPSPAELEREVAEIRARIAAGAEGNTLAELLDRLCGLRIDLGQRDEARKTCERVMRVFPGSVFAARAHAALSRLGAGGASQPATRSNSPRE